MMTETTKLDSLRIAELQAADIPRLSWRDLLKWISDDGSEIPEEDAKALDEYFRRFAKPIEKGKCLNCGIQQGGLMSALLGGFTWGLAHGEGFCSACKYPGRALHYDVGPIKRMETILQYHPSELKPDCPHEDFTENQEGDRTCTKCGTTTDAPEPGHYAGCVCVECHGGELTDND